MAHDHHNLNNIYSGFKCYFAHAGVIKVTFTEFRQDNLFVLFKTQCYL